MYLCSGLRSAGGPVVGVRGPVLRRGGLCRDEGRADSVSLRQRCQAGHVTPQQTPESVRLRIAEFGELSRRIHHRTVVLT